MDFRYINSSLLDEREIIATSKSLLPYIQHMQDVANTETYDFDESSMNLPFDTKTYDKVMQLVDTKVTDALEYIFVIGIGGSNLGTKAIYDALQGYFDTLTLDKKPKIIFVDTNDPHYLQTVQAFLEKFQPEPRKILLNAITKSGTTTETIVNLETIAETLPFDTLKERLVITTVEDTKLWNQAIENGIEVLPMPKKVGGRYSVLSTVGLFPLLAAGIDIQSLLDGAQIERGHCISEETETNPAALSAAIQYLHYKNEKQISNLFVFHPELESLGKWYRQLMGESVGKETDLDGNTIHAGIVPTVSVGSVDLHSVAQLYLGGPNNTYTTFVSTKKSRQDDVALRSNLVFPNIVDEISNKSAAEIMWAILEGVKVAYRTSKRPYTEIVLEDISAHELGHFLQFKMLEMMYLAKLMNVNAFDQPNVEEYKVETKKILSGKPAN